jgi:hypothetical protein
LLGSFVKREDKISNISVIRANNLYEDQFEALSCRSIQYFMHLFAGRFFNDTGSTAQIFISKDENCYYIRRK